MEKQQQQEELSTDFFSEVEMEIDSNLEVLDDEEEEESSEVEEEVNEEENQEEELDVDLEEESEEEATGEAEEEDPEEIPLVRSIQESLGYEFDEEFEDTEEGIQQLVQASANKLADDTLGKIFEQYPDVQELFEYRRLGGDPNKFFETKFPEVDFTEVEFKEEDSEQHEMIVRNELREQGYDTDYINAELEDYKNGGILEKKAKRALDVLRTKQQERKSQLLEEQREQARQQQEQINQYWNEVKETIDGTSNFKGFTIPAKDKDDFFDYISKPVEDGMSQRDIDVNNADAETRLAIDYLLYKGFDLSGLVDRKAKNQNAKKLRERLTQSKLDRKKARENKVQTGADVELGTL